MHQDTLTRKEIAALTGDVVSELTIGRREDELFLTAARIKFTARPILYWRDKAIEGLEKAGVLKQSKQS